MKTIRLLVWMLAVCLLATVSLPAQNGEDEAACSAAMIKGDYAFVQYGLSTMHEEPLPLLPGNGIGVWRSDGEGSITAYRSTLKNGRNRTIEVWDLDAGKMEKTEWGEPTPTEITVPPIKFSYTVEPDCRGKMTVTAPNGTVTWQSHFVVLNGGREVLYTSIFPHWGMAVGTFRRIGDFDQQVEDKLAEMDAKIDAIQDMISKMAVAMGFPPN